MKKPILLTVLVSLLACSQAGAQWEKVFRPTRTVAFCNAVLGDYLLVQNNEGCQLSDDGGLTWDDAAQGLPEFHLLSPAIFEDAHLLAVEYYSGSLMAYSHELQTWIPFGEGLPNGGYAVELAACQGALLLLAYDASFSSNKIYRSTNGGASWTATEAGMPDGFLPFSLRSTVAGAVAGGAGGACFSTDGGLNWQPTDPAGTCGVEYVTGGLGLFLFTKDLCYNNLASQNGGASWHHAAGLPADFYPYGIAATETKIFMNGCCDYANPNGGTLFFSEDGGINWQPAAGLPLTTSQTIGNIVRAGASLYLTGDDKLFLSADGGETWAQSAQVTDIAYPWLTASADGQAVCSGDGGIFKAENGGWTSLAEGLPKTPFAMQTVWAKDSLVLAGTGYECEFFRSTDFGQAFEKSELCGIAHVIEAGGALFAAAVYNSEGALFKSADGGLAWEPVTSGLQNPDAWGVSLFFLLDAGGGKLYAAGTGGSIFASADGGETWELKNFGIPPWSSVVSLAWDEVHGKLYAGTWGDYLFQSSDQGESWTAAGFYPAASLAAKDGTVYAWSDEQVFFSSDGGETWQSGSHAQMAGGYASTAAMVVYNQHVLAGSTNGVFLSSDQAETWEPYNTGLPTLAEPPAVAALAAGDHHLYAACLADGIFRRSLAQLPVGAPETWAGAFASLSPNPASDAATLRFSLRKPAETLTVRLVSALGQEVFSKNLQNVLAGEVPLALDELPPGAYAAHLSDGERTLVERLVVSR